MTSPRWRVRTLELDWISLGFKMSQGDREVVSTRGAEGGGTVVALIF